jgi:hypothetical protein
MSTEDRKRPDDSPEEQKPFGSDGDDNICDQCDSTGEVDGRVCTNCNGKGYLNP